MRCSARPYEGHRNYIFVSYCHKDKQRVYPIIERLVQEGFRVWYDEGINPGSEWPEIIAEHLTGCATYSTPSKPYVIYFVSGGVVINPQLFIQRCFDDAFLVNAFL